MGLDDPRLQKGLDLLQRREWYRAHEEFEAAWLDEPGEERDFIQALVHIAVAFEHLARGNPGGTRSQWRKAQRKLRKDLGARVALDVTAWAARIEAFFATIELDARAAGTLSTTLPASSCWPTPDPTRDGRL